MNNYRNTGDGYEKKITENNTVPCHSRKILLWLVLLDNIPTLLLFLLGFLIIYQVSLTGAIVFGTYALFSVDLNILEIKLSVLLSLTILNIFYDTMFI